MKFSVFYPVILVAALVAMASCGGNTDSSKENYDIEGQWAVDSIVTVMYPADSVVKTVYGKEWRQIVTFEKGTYSTSVWHNDTLMVKMDFRYSLSGDTIDYSTEKVTDIMPELIKSCDDSKMVTRTATRYTDQSTDYNTIYYTRITKAIPQ